jgi:hypothetical protein
MAYHLTVLKQCKDDRSWSVYALQVPVVDAGEALKHCHGLAQDNAGCTGLLYFRGELIGRLDLPGDSKA